MTQAKDTVETLEPSGATTTAGKSKATATIDLTGKSTTATATRAKKGTAKKGTAKKATTKKLLKQ